MELNTGCKTNVEEQMLRIVKKFIFPSVLFSGDNCKPPQNILISEKLLDPHKIVYFTHTDYFWQIFFVLFIIFFPIWKALKIQTT